MTVKEQIKALFEDQKELSVKELSDELMVSKQFVHRALKDLMEENFIYKLGSPPKTIYKLNSSTEPVSKYESTFTSDEKLFLQKHFLVITEIGAFLEGGAAFEYWCRKRELPLEKTYREFVLTKTKYQSYYNSAGLVDGYQKLLNTEGFDKIWIDALYYLDFYAIERFGKTKLGSILHYAKQGQHKKLMKLLADEIKQRIDDFIAENKYDAVAFIPPTIKRETQIMKFLEQHLRLKLPHISISKISNMIPVPQKSLSKLYERINNADNSFVVKSNQEFKNILLIDDAVGSGATVNQISAKIKNKGIAEKITAVAVVGSFKGFDVITDI